MIWLHRKEQWDLECWPWICAHWRYPNGSTRFFCVWSGGIQIGSWLWRWSPKELKRE